MRIVWMISLFIGASAFAETFSLKNKATGELTGPIEFQHGEEIALGTNVYRVIRSATEVVDVRALMHSIQIKELVFRETDVRDVIEFLRDTSREKDPSGAGANFVMLPFANMKASGAVVSGDRYKRVTMNIRDMNMYDALLLIKEITGYQFQIKSNTIFIQPR